MPTSGIVASTVFAFTETLTCASSGADENVAETAISTTKIGLNLNHCPLNRKSIVSTIKPTPLFTPVQVILPDKRKTHEPAGCRFARRQPSSGGGGGGCRGGGARGPRLVEPLVQLRVAKLIGINGRAHAQAFERQNGADIVDVDANVGRIDLRRHQRQREGHRGANDARCKPLKKASPRA